MIGNHKKLFTQSDNRVKFRIKGRKTTTIPYFAVPVILIKWMTRHYVPEF
jgi:hypothetical protein